MFTYTHMKVYNTHVFISREKLLSNNFRKFHKLSLISIAPNGLHL